MKSHDEALDELSQALDAFLAACEHEETDSNDIADDLEQLLIERGFRCEIIPKRKRSPYAVRE